MNIHIQSATPDDYLTLRDIWSRSVLATHHFLKPEDYAEIKEQLIPNYFPAVSLYKAVDLKTLAILGFIGVLNHNIEMLFIDAEIRGKGVGRKLLNFAIDKLDAKFVDVNAQNTQALNFYLRYGCTQIKYSELDSAGKPYPILTLQLPHNDEE